MSSSFLSRLRNRLPSKRKLDDYALNPPLTSSDLPFSDDDDANSSPTMRNKQPSPPFSLDLNLPPSIALSSFSPSLLSSSLQFFVRIDSKTLVLHSSPFDTVSSVLDRIAALAGLPAASRSTTDHRLIYRGRQLDPDSTLTAAAVQPDSILHLTGRLRSTRFPRAWRLVGDLFKSVEALLLKQPLPREVSTIENVVTEFLTSTPDKSGVMTEEEHDALVVDYLKVFVSGCAPAELVKLYLSKIPSNRIVAERAVSFFLNPNDAEFLNKTVQVQCWGIVLEFCKLIGGTAGKIDGLYISCRSTLASLLVEAQGSPKSGGSLVVVKEILPFVGEVAGIVMTAMSLESMLITASELVEFENFLVVMRLAAKNWIGGEGCISKSLLNSSHPRFEVWVGALYDIYIELVGKIDECLQRVADYLGEKKGGSSQSDARWASWSPILTIITNVHSFSKIYVGATELLHRILVHRRAPVNALIKRAKKNDNLRWLLKYKDVTDFESRKSLALMLFPAGKDDYEHLHEMLIDRAQLLAESFEYIGMVDAHALHGGLFMEFKNEEATGPGVLREWFCLVCRAIFNPQNVLFLQCPNDRRRFFPNPASVVDPLHLKYFGFCGRVIALALMHKIQIGVVFDHSFLSQLAGKIVTLEDVKDADPFLYMSCKKILEMDAELLDSDILGLTFVREIVELGTQREVELCPGGKDMSVNSSNREEYIDLLIQHRFGTSVSEQVSQFGRGFSDILSNTKFQKYFFNCLDPEDFDKMIGGCDGILNVRDWKAHTEYNGYRAKDRQISWFWKIVEGMSEEQQRVLLFFWTSVKYLPVDGFGGLASKLYIYKAADSHDRLPTSHTCFYRLCLPQYPSIAMMRDRLLFITQEHVSCTFGMW